MEHLVSSARTRIAASRYYLMKVMPFFGHLLTAIPIDLDHQGTMAVSNEGLYGVIHADPEYVASLEQDELNLVLMHEVLHPALRFFGRQRGREDQPWNVAHDHVDNLALASVMHEYPHLHLAWPKGSQPFMDECYLGMVAEDVYDRIFSRPTSDQPASHASEEGSQGVSTGLDGAKPGSEVGNEGDPNVHQEDGAPGRTSDGHMRVEPRAGGKGFLDATDCVLVQTPDQNKADVQRARTLQDQALRRLVSEAMEMQRTRGRLPGSFEILIQAAWKVHVPWAEDLVHRVEGHLKGESVSYAHLSKRSAAAGIMLPGRSRRRPRIGLVLDTSESNHVKELKGFLGTIRMIAEGNEAGCRLLQVDTQIRMDEDLDDLDVGFSPRFSVVGRGGTNFEMVPERLADSAYEPVDLIVIFTDGIVAWPDHSAWPAPVLVVTTHREPPPPYEWIRFDETA